MCLDFCTLSGSQLRTDTVSVWLAGFLPNTPSTQRVSSNLLNFQQIIIDDERPRCRIWPQRLATSGRREMATDLVIGLLISVLAVNARGRGPIFHPCHVQPIYMTVNY